MELVKLDVSGCRLKHVKVKKCITVIKEQVSILLQAMLLDIETNKLQEELIQAKEEKKEQENMLIQQSKLAQTGEMISMLSHQWRQEISKQRSRF